MIQLFAFLFAFLSASVDYIVPDWELLVIAVMMLCFGFFPPVFLVIRCPEGLTFLKSQIFGKGEVIVASEDDSAVTSLLRARPYGREGQYITGPDRFGKRIIFVLPRFEDKIFTHRSILKGIRKPFFLHYKGKTGMASAGTLAAIEVVERDRLSLPPQVQAWAKENKIITQQTISEEDKKGNVIEKVKTAVEVLFTLDPRKLRDYFHDHYDESQYDVLLEQKYQQGANSRGLGGFKLGGGFIIILAVGVMGIVGVLLAMKMGWIHGALIVKDLIWH